MKLIKSTIKRDKPIGELPQGKVSITMQGEDKEVIWVAKDEENKVMYLLNHAFMFYPVPSWGMELPLQSGPVDLYQYRGDKFEDTKFTVCEEAYDGLAEFLDEEGNFNVEGYIDFCNKAHEEAKNAGTDTNEENVEGE